MDPVPFIASGIFLSWSIGACLWSNSCFSDNTVLSTGNYEIQVPAQGARADDFSYTPSERNLIPEIVDLPDSGAVPPDIYEKYDSRAIAESIIEHLHRVKVLALAFETA